MKPENRGGPRKGAGLKKGTTHKNAMKEDEIGLMIAMLYKRNESSPRDIINDKDFTMNYKRAWYLLQKWGKKGWYDYGVTLDLGWLTDAGIVEAKKISGGDNQC